MRWDGQAANADDGALPGLGRAGLASLGLVRSVRTPEFAGITFHEVHAKSALTKVPDASRMPFRWTVNPYRGCSHACVYCLSPDTLVLMADGRHRPVGDVVVGDRIVGTAFDGRCRRYVETTVEDRWSTVKRAHRVTLADGTVIVASGDHRFLTSGRGWKHVAPDASGRQRPVLTTNDSLVGFGLGRGPLSWPQPHESQEYRRGYLTGMIRGDGMMIDRSSPRRHGGTYRITAFRRALADLEALDRSAAFLRAEGFETYRRALSPETSTRRAVEAIHTSERTHFSGITKLIDWPSDPSSEWQRGFLAGIFDAEGRCSQGVLRISDRDDEILSRTSACLDALGIDNLRERADAIGVSNIRIVGGLAARQRFFRTVSPAISRKMSILGGAITSSSDLRVLSVEDLGVDVPMVDITTGTGDFIANGVVSHNCYARPTHEYLDMDAGADFDSQVVVKTNVDQVLRAELARPSWARETVALGTNTDPYQRAEGRYRLMPGIIAALADSGTPFSILTKGTLLRRDLPLLVDAAQRVDVGIGVSLAFADAELQQRVEPGTPTPRARLDLIRAVRDTGLPCGVMVAPVLPWLTDSRDHLRRLFDAIADAGATGVKVLPLHLRPGAREWYLEWLEREHPHAVAGYRRVFGRGAYVHRGYQEWLQERVRPLLAERGLSRSRHRPERRDGGDVEGDYPAGSMVSAPHGPGSVAPEPEGDRLF